MIKLSGGRIILEQVITEHNLYFDKGKIVKITPENLPCDEEINVKGAYIAAGFIDIHTHGAGGFDFMDGTVNAVSQAAKMHLHHGTTTLLPTTLSYGIQATRHAIQDIKQAVNDTQLPNIVGVHLEGPYFSPEQAGAQNPKFITSPCKKDYEQLVIEANGFIKRWSFAPEIEGAIEFCEYLVAHNISPSIGHSNAEYPHVLKAYEAGCKSITHFYSAMSTIVRKNAYRILGVVESAYLLDDMMVEVIADGYHLPKELLQLIYKLKGADNICMVTDSMRGAGMEDGPSVLGRLQDGLPCIIEDGVAKLIDKSAFAGSVATFDRLVRVFNKQIGVSIEQCIKMASTNPAKELGLANSKGKLAVGYDADIVVFDDDINIQLVAVSKNNSTYITYT